MSSTGPAVRATGVSSGGEVVRRAATPVAGIVAGIGGAGLAAWLRPHHAFAPGTVPLFMMNPLASVCLVLAGAGMALSLAGRRRWALVMAVVILAIAGAKAVDLVTSAVPIDRFLLPARPMLPATGVPGTMAPGALFGLLLCGASLALAQHRRASVRLASQLVAIWLVLLASLALLGYVFDLMPVFATGTTMPMALPTAAGLAAAGVGLLLLTPEVGLMLMLGDDGPAGSICRTILPLVVVVAAISGLFRLWGERLGYFDSLTGAALQVLSNVVVTSIVLVMTALALYRTDHARRRRARELRRSDYFNRLIASANPDCVSLIGKDNTVLFANEALLRSHGLGGHSDLVGLPCGHHHRPERRAVIEAALIEAREAGRARFTMSFEQADGEVRWFDTLVSRLPDDAEMPGCLLSVSRDITEKKAVEDRVQWQALHDHLTSLPNRAHFHAEVERRFAAPAMTPFAVLMLDIDDFKLVNDTLGHDAGDVLLATIARRIVRGLRDEDFVARLGGDEFAVVLGEVCSEAGVAAAADRILDNLREPWTYHGRLGDCRVSIGASIAGRHGDDVAELLKSADIALYSAKARGKGQLCVFQAGMKSTIEKRSRQLALARQALREDRIVPFYQPKVDLALNSVCGFEALLRLRRPRGGVQLPATIEAAFGDMGLAGQITECMLSHVLLDIGQWLDQGLEFGHVAINLTAADLRQPDFAERLLTRLHARSIPHHCLQAEVTETVFLGRGAEYVERTLQTLHDHGVKVALDDFGTGYASLSHLKQFPVDIVKIDRSFLRDFSDPQSKAIIATVVGLGHSLNIEVVAEGVETQEQAHYLVSRGCMSGQGHLFGRALPAARVPGLCRTGQRDVRRAA